MVATVIALKITFSLNTALAEDCGRLQKEMLNQSNRSTEDRRRPQKHAEHRRIQKSSQKMAEETSIDSESSQKSAERRRRPQKIA